MFILFLCMSFTSENFCFSVHLSIYRHISQLVLVSMMSLLYCSYQYLSTCIYISLLKIIVMVTPLGLSVDPFKNDTPRGVKEIRALLSIFIAIR